MGIYTHPGETPMIGGQFVVVFVISALVLFVMNVLVN